MEVKYLKDEKNEAEIELGSMTIAEILRDCLSEDESVSFVAWKREHPTKNPILKINTKGKTVRKAVSDAIAIIEKDVDKLVDELKKSK
ncbi:MAG: RpoL/Rpb11 RNA polymerase subunit family protein [Nanoarchaeota archaeon]